MANIPAATTSKYGVTQLSSSTSSTSTSLAATPSAVKAAYDLANGKQDKLVSGTNIKTINGQSILGSGDISIKSGGNYPIVNIVNNQNVELQPNTYYALSIDNQNIGTLVLGFAPNVEGVVNEYIIECRNETGFPLQLVLPENIKWFGNKIPSMGSPVTIISIVNNLAVYAEFSLI